MEFPRLVYKSAAQHVAVNDKDELDARLAEGWFASVPEALAPKAPEVSIVVTKEAPHPLDHDGDGKKGGSLPRDDDPPTRKELEAKATELHIKFDGRTTDKRLGELIAHALKGK